MLNTQVLFVIAFLVTCCSLSIAQEFSADASVNLELQARDRRSLDVGWLLRNLLLNSATASDLKANVTRTIAAAKRPLPLPITTRRPRSTRPPTTQPPPPSPAPPAPPLHPLLNLFASSSGFFKAPPTTTTTTTEAPPPPTPPTRRPRPRPRPYPHPSYGYDYDYFYPSGYDEFVRRGASSANPSEYDYQDAPAPQSFVQRKSAPNRQRPASPAPAPPARRRPATSAPNPAPAPAPAPPQPQRERLLYQYAQRDDISFNDNNDDAAETPPESATDADTQQQDGSVSDEQDGADAANGTEDNGNAADGGDNDIPSFADDAPPPEVLSPRLGSPGRHQYSKLPSAPSFDSQSYSYYGSDSPSEHRFKSLGTSSASGGSGFGHASPAKAFSDFHTTYDGSHFQPSVFGSYT